MKTERHDTILRLIREYSVDTQSELLALLQENGYAVTQATVSRDLKDLRLVKTLGADGHYHYAAGASYDGGGYPQLQSLFAHSVLSVDHAGHIVVLKCVSGMAQGVCAAMDALHWKTVVGTLAGDDTIICVMRTEADAQEMDDKLTNMK